MCILLILVSGCRKDDLIVNPQPEYKGIIPLAIGNKWNFNIYAYDTTGAIIVSNILSYEVIGDSMINGSRWFKISNFLCANRSNGFSSLSNSDQLLIFKYPAAAQDSFYVNGVVNYLHVASIDTTITISLGTYHCYAFDSHQLISPGAFGGSYEILYVSPEVGIVKGEVYAAAQVGKKQYLWATTELSSVTLK
jgi:hypothetical protein